MKDRIFTTKDKDGEDLVLLFKRPTQKILSKAELVYREKYSEVFRAGLLLNTEVTQIMKKRGLWDDSKELEADAMRTAIAGLEKKLADPSLSNVDGQILCLELSKSRFELMSHNSMLTSVTDNTVESVANEERNQFLTAACVYNNKTGAKVYKDVEDFKSRSDELITVDSYRETVIASLEVVMGRDLSSDLTEEYAENKWLKGRGLGADEDGADEDGLEKVEEVEEPKPAKKKRAKAKTKKIKVS